MADYWSPMLDVIIVLAFTVITLPILIRWGNKLDRN